MLFPQSSLHPDLYWKELPALGDGLPSLFFLEMPSQTYLQVSVNESKIQAS